MTFLIKIFNIIKFFNMCWFTWFSFENKHLLLKMWQTLKDRAIDKEYFYYEDNLSFYHAHLAISDLNKDTSQPLVYKDFVLWLVWEIYNKQYLLNLTWIDWWEDNFTELEVIWFCYEKLWENFINYVNWEFSIFIYDRSNKEYFLFRDRWWVNNAYYRLYNWEFFFSSEIKSLILNKPKINKESFIEHIIFQFWISPNTIIKDIYTLKPWTYLKYKEWKSNIYNFKPYIYQEDNENIIEAIENSVKRRIPKYQKNIFISLSGWPDSNLIMFFLKKYYEWEIIAYSFLTNENYLEIDIAKHNCFLLWVKHLCIDMNNYSHIENLNKNLYIHEWIVELPNFLYLLKTYYPEYYDVKVEFWWDGKEELFNINKHYDYKDIFSTYKYFYSKWLIKSYEINQEFLNKNMFDFNLQLYDKVTLRNWVERRLPFTDYELLKFYWYNHLIYKPDVVKYLWSFWLRVLTWEMGFNSWIKFRYLKKDVIKKYSSKLIKIFNENLLIK